jgi:hypothetical protein
MKQDNLERFAARVKGTAGGFQYPVTPNIWSAVSNKLDAGKPGLRRGRRLAWTAIAILFAAGLFLASVPGARAALREMIRVGVINIFFGDPVPSPVSEGTMTVEPHSPVNALPYALAGEIAFEELQQRVPFDLKLPSYPADLDEPDFAFYQEQAGGLAILVWMDETDPEAVRVSLHILTGEAFVAKIQPRILETTQVGGAQALWTEGPYYLYVENLGLQPRRLVEGNVLIWEDGDLTYRLESALPLEQAVRIAESLE